MKIFKNLTIKIISLILISPGLYSVSIEESLKQAESASKQEALSLSDVPQFKAYTSYIPAQILDFLSKLQLKNITVGFDSSAKTGVINAETNVAGQKSVIRLIVGPSGTIDKNQLSQSLQAAAEKFQRSNVSEIKKYPQAQNWNQAGLTYFNGPLSKVGLIKNKDQNQQDTTQTENKTDNEKAAEVAAQTLENKEKQEVEQKEAISKTQKALDAIKSGAQGLLGKLADFQVGIVIALPQGFSFGQISQDLQFLDAIKANETAIGLGNGFYDPIYGMMPPGLSVVAKIGLTEPFTTINNFVTKVSRGTVNLKDTPLELRGNINRSIGGSSLGLELPGQIGFNLGGKKFIETDKLTLQVILLPSPEGTGTSGVSFGLSGGLTLYLNAIDSKLSPLDFKALFSIDSSASAILIGSMNGLLDLSPIKLPLKFGNVTLQGGLNPENVETLGISDIGMAGELDFGPQDAQTKIQAAFDVRLSGQQSNILAYGELQPTGSRKSALALSDILNLAIKAYSHLGGSADKFKSSIPELGIKQAKFYFSPANVFFANKVWPAGLSIDAALDLFGSTASVEFNINSNGFDGTGYLSPVTLGPVKITGAGKSKTCSDVDMCLVPCGGTTNYNTKPILKPGVVRDPKAPSFKLDAQSAPQSVASRTDYSKEQGAILNLYYYPPTNIGLFLSADVIVNLGKLGTINADACMKLSTSGIYLHFSENVFNVLETDFTLNAKDFKQPKEWYVCAKMKQSAINILYDKIHQFTLSSKKDVDNALTDAQNKVKDAQKTFNNAMNTAQSALKTAQDYTDKLQKDIDKAKRQCGL
ncbi:hypothetical protein [Candidatus Babela massiliensis]|uniref:Uncharacterized protein n=1 Tax=Candidatus Babela massiliensis TaxID=673862 RepID=V6DF60_9BACT|nr:hypothetical protein [Candidatus Babela massiliensis]CDK30232.1 hypothetical protein BABL1_gene_926 [Candidatus Babela massiliensis]